MPMKLLGWVLSAAALVLAAGGAVNAAHAGAAGPTVGSRVRQPAGVADVRTYDVRRSGWRDVWV